MKKFIMTAIVICLSIATAIPFHLTKAMSQVRPEVNKTITWDNMTIGWYNHYAYLTSGSEYINTSQFGVGPVGYYKTVDVITVGFDYKITGEICFSFTGSMSNYQMIYIDGADTGSYRWSGSNSVLYVSMTSCQSFDIYMYSTTQYAQNALPSKINNYFFTTFALDDEVFNSSYAIPIQSVQAYEFPCNTTPPLDFIHGDVYPVLHIDHADQGCEYSKTLYLTSYNNTANAVYFCFMAKTSIAGSYTLDANNVVCALLQPGIRLSNYTVYQMMFNVSNTQSSGNVTIWWDEDVDMIPLYLGTRSNCPLELYSLCGFGSTPIVSISDNVNEIWSLLDDIYMLLSANVDQGQTSQDISDIADDFGDITDDEHQISSGFQDDLDDFNESIDLQDFDFLTGIANASEYFKIQLENVFNNSVNLRAMWVLPVICIVLLKLLGG